MNRDAIVSLVGQVKMRLFPFDPMTPLLKSPTITEDDLYRAWVIFEKKLHHVRYEKEERKEIFRAFVISYVGHLYAKKRESGEAYFYHLFRCGMKILYDQTHLGIKDVDAVVTILLHDVIEEAENSSTFFSPHLVFITKNIVVSYFGERIAEMVHYLSRQKRSGEGRIEHLTRVASAPHFQVIWGKLSDIRDNFDTLSSMPLEKQKNKFLEAKEKLNQLLDSLETLILREYTAGNLVGDGWLKLRKKVKRSLQKSIKRQKKRLQGEGVHIP